MVSSLLTVLLKKPEVFNQVAASSDPVAAMQDLGQQLGFSFSRLDLEPDQETIDPVKRWEIFSRVRFEYVRPFCTLRSLNAPSVFPSMSDADREYGLKAYIWAGLKPDKQKISALLKALTDPKQGTLAAALKQYYEASGAINPSTQPSLFPASYIVVHDLHHVLTNIPVSDRGELEIIAFESGMLYRCPPPVLLIEQLEILLADKTDVIHSPSLIRAWNAGTRSSLLLENWDWLSDLPRPIEAVRQQYGIEPLYA